MHASCSHGSVQHRHQGAALLTSELYGFEFALQAAIWVNPQDCCTTARSRCRTRHTLLSCLTDKVNSCSSALLDGTVIPSKSASETKSHLLVIIRESGCCVVTHVVVMHSTRRYLPLQDTLVHRNLPMQSGGICPSAACRKWSK